MNKLMKFFSKNEVTRKIMNEMIRRAPELMAATAVCGTITTAVQAYKARPKCDAIIAEHKKNLEKVAQNDSKGRREIYLQTGKKLIPALAPTLVFGALTIASILSGHTVMKKRLVAVTAAYNVAEGALKDLQVKMKETLGKDKVTSVIDAVAEDKVKSNPQTPDNTEEINKGTKTTLCYDSYSGRYFRSSAMHIERAINKVSSMARHEMYVTLNDFYDEIGLKHTECGMDVGWNGDDCIEGSLPITLSACLTEDSEPCLAIYYNNSLRAV